MSREMNGVADVAPLRIGQRLARAVRRFAWVAATGSVILLGSGFAWALGRAGQAPPAPPLPPAEARLVQQSDQLSSQIAAEQRQLAAINSQVEQLTGASSGQGGSLGQGGGYSQMPMPRAHGFTGAS